MSALSITTSAAATPLTLVVGTYTGSGSRGVYTCRIDPVSLEVEALDSVQVDNPSYLVVAPDGRHLAAGGVGGPGGSRVGALSRAPATGRMQLLGSVDAQCADPCHITFLSPRTLSVAGYSSGTLVLFDLNDDGTVTQAVEVLQFHATSIKRNQASSHIHYTAVAPDGRHLLATNLGGDLVYVFDIVKRTARGTARLQLHGDVQVAPGTGPRHLAFAPDGRHLLATNLGGDLVYVFDIVKRTARGTARLQLHGDVQVAPGTGPRHLAFAPDGRHCYVLGELSDDVLAYDYDDGRLGLLQTLNAALRPAHGGGDIHIDPSGRYLYASVRLVDDGIAIYKIEPDGRLTRAGYQLTGRHPRNFMITPDGRLLLCACRDDNVIQLYSIDPATGLLTRLGRDLHVSKPVCIKLVP